MRSIRSALLPAAILAFAGSVRAADQPAVAKITYDEHVRPILREHCFSCHGPDKTSSSLAVHTYAGIMAGGSSGVVVKPGDPDDSRLYLLMAHKQRPEMPPKLPTLDQAKLDVVQKWIAGGALENAGSKTMPIKPKTDIGLTSIVRGRPAVPPMPSKPLLLEPVVKTTKANAVTALAASPWAPLVAVGGQKQVLLYQSDRLELLGVLPFPEGVPHVLRFSRNGSLLLAGGGHDGKSGRVVVWNVATGERVIEVGEETDAVLAADISADQTQVALGGPSKVVRVYSTKDGSLLREIRKHTDWIYSLEYSPDGVLLATADRSGNVLVWEAFTGREYFSLRGHTGAVTGMSWRLDSNVLATMSEDTTLRLWEMENGGQIKLWAAHPGGGQSVQFTHDNRLVSCGRDRGVRVWDQNGTAQKAPEALPDVAVRCCFTHDGARLLAGDWTGNVRVWDAKDGKPLGTLAPNPPGVAERLESASREVTAKQAAYDQAVASSKASEAAVLKATTDLAAAQKALADATNTVKAAQDAVAKAGPAADAEDVKAKTAQDVVAAKDVLAKAYVEAAAKVKAAADAAKASAALADAAARAKANGDAAMTDLAAAQKALADAQAAAKAAAEARTRAQQALAAVQAAAGPAAKNVEAAQAALKNAEAKLAADKSVVDIAAAALNEARAAVERLKTAATVAKGK